MNKALYVIPYPKFFSQHAGVGGHVAHAAGVIGGLVEHGYNVRVVAEGNHDIFDIHGVDVDLLPCASQSQISRQLWSLKLLMHIKKLLREERFSLCYMRYSASFAPWIPLLKRLLGSVPLILEVNSLGSQWRESLRPLDRWALSSVDRVICISQVLQDYVVGLLGQRANDADIRLVINGVNVSRFDVEPVELGSKEIIHAGFAGLLKTDYGIETLIEAAGLLRDENVVLHVFGDGPFRSQLEQLAIGFDNIRFHGPVPFLRMPAFLKALDVVIYTTDVKHLYQSPTKLFEYMAAGKPIVSARTPQTTELLSTNETALFFDVADAQDMADAISRLCRDVQVREAMGKRARQEAETKHSWFARVAQILA